MSLQTLCDRDACTIKRLVTTQGTAGGQVRSYTTAARGSLPTTSTGRFQIIRADERTEYGVKGNVLAWKHFTTTYPAADVRDQFTFTDDDGVARTARVISPTQNLDGQGRLYLTILEEDTNRT